MKKFPSSLPVRLLIGVLGFNEDGTALMLTIFALQDMPKGIILKNKKSALSFSRKHGAETGDKGGRKENEKKILRLVINCTFSIVAVCLWK